MAVLNAIKTYDTRDSTRYCEEFTSLGQGSPFLATDVWGRARDEGFHRPIAAAQYRSDERLAEFAPDRVRVVSFGLRDTGYLSDGHRTRWCERISTVNAESSDYGVNLRTVQNLFFEQFLRNLMQQAKIGP